MPPQDPSVSLRFSPSQLRNPLRKFRWPPRFSGGTMLALAKRKADAKATFEAWLTSATLDSLAGSEWHLAQDVLRKMGEDMGLPTGLP